MPRSNGPRTIVAEAFLAEQIRIRRDRENWTHEGLVKRMEEVGCKIHLSALYKIEKADPPRRITVDELVGFSAVFGVPMADLVADPRLELPSEAIAIWERISAIAARGQAHQQLADEAQEEVNSLILDYNELIESHPEIVEAVSERLSDGGERQARFDQIRDATLDRLRPTKAASRPRKAKA